MAAATGRKTVSIYDYPEHLNPFREEDNHNRIRFWTLGRKLNRSNSINFSGIKELKNSWAFRSFMRKGKKGHSASQEHKPHTNGVNGDSSSPIVFRRALQYSSAANSGAISGSRSTIGSPERPDRYVYGGSVTPLPRSRFQERLRSPSQHEVNALRGTSMTPRLARSEVAGSQLSVASNNPFDEAAPEPPARAPRAPRRKKKKAPLPPALSALPDVTLSSIVSETKDADTTVESADLEAEIPLNIELRIVEEDETKQNEDSENGNTEKVQTVVKEITSEEVVEVRTKTDIDKPEIALNGIDKDSSQSEAEKQPETKETTDGGINEFDSDDDLPGVPFPKVDIITYRRNSSLTEDDFKLRRGNIEHEISNKRSKSLTAGLNNSFVTYDINLNEDVISYNEPTKVVCKLYDAPRKPSLDTSVSSTEREFIEIDKATRELEREISKLNSALVEDDNDVVLGARLSVSDIKNKFDNNNLISPPNPIPKPKRSPNGSNSPINGNY